MALFLEVIIGWAIIIGIMKYIQRQYKNDPLVDDDGIQVLYKPRKHKNPVTNTEFFKHYCDEIYWIIEDNGGNEKVLDAIEKRLHDLEELYDDKVEETENAWAELSKYEKPEWM